MSDRRPLTLALAVAVLVSLAGIGVYLVVAHPPASGGGSEVLVHCGPTPVDPEGGNWTTYHADNSRSADVTDSGSRARATWATPTPVDGQVYAEPLVCGSHVYVATEDDSVYSLNATTGAVEWRTPLGLPVPGGGLPCGDINPSGITGTPVIDPASGLLYVVAFLSPAHHELFGLSLATGAIRSQVAADPAGADPTVEQQRGALALANGYVYVPYGGLAGDCGAYHGWVAGIPVTGSGASIAYQVPTQREGGIWAPGGISVAPNGTLYVATGNGASTSTYDFGDSVIELSPSLTEVGSFAPTNWIQLNQDDTDLGSLAPTVLPNGDVFQVGKAGVGYLLSGGHLGGVGGQVALGPVCAGAYGGTARAGLSVLVPCTNGLFDVVVGTSNFSVAWGTTAFDAGSPIITGNLVWTVDVGAANLLAFNLTTGQLEDSFPIASADPFISPAASGDAVVVAGGFQIYSISLS